MAQATLSIHAPDAEPEGTDLARPAGRRRSWLAPAVLILCSVTAWFAPGVAARTGLRHRIIDVVVPEFPGTSSVGSASLGWTSPVILDDLRLYDQQGRELVRIDSLRTSVPLATLVFGGSNDLGVILLKRPQASIVLRSGGSNLEDCLQPILAAPGSGSSGMTVKIEEGSVLWTTIDGQPSPGGFVDVAATIVQPAGSSLPMHVDGTGQVSDGEHVSAFSIRARPGEGQGALVRTEMVVAAANVPLAPFQPWLDRFDVPASVTGLVSADLVASVPTTGVTEWQLGGRVEGNRLWMTLSGSPLQDRLTLEKVAFTGRVEQNGDGLIFDDVRLQGDIGQATASGQIDLARVRTATTWQEIADAVLDSDAKLTGTIDLTRISSALPQTIQVKQPITSGTVQFVLQTTSDESVRRAVVSVDTSDVVAGANVWPKPLTANITLRRDGNSFEAEQIRAVGEFLSVQGSASSRGAEIGFELDLARLRNRLAPLISLPEGALDGQANGRLTLAAGVEPDRLRVEGQAALKNLSLRTRTLQWAERELTAVGSADFLLAESRVKSLENGGLTIRSTEGDELTLSLTESVAIGPEAIWPFALTTKGEASRWFDRARAWSILPATPGWTVAGALDAKAGVRYGAEQVDLTGAVVELANARLQLAGRSFDEPRIRLAGDARWENASGLLSFPRAELTSDTLVLSLEELRLPVAGDALPAGRVAFRGGIGRLMRYVMPDHPAIWLSGVTHGTVTLQPTAAGLDAQTEFELERPILTRPVAVPGKAADWQQIWADERVVGSIAAAWSSAGERLELRSARLTGKGFAIDVAGTVDRLTTTADAQLRGTFGYELETLQSQLAALLPSDVAMSGKGQKPFVIRGPLTVLNDGLTAQAGIGWDRLALWGNTIGAGEITGTLERRTVRFTPIDWPFSDGRLRGTMLLSLLPEPSLSVARGRVVDNVTLTPDMTRRWIRYAAPSLADTAVVDGRISFDVANATIPLIDPTRTHAVGVLDVGGVKATPGAFVKSMVGVVGQIQAVLGKSATSGSDLQLVATPQRVNLKVESGRVFHDRFAVQLGDADGIVIATTGSVGFDETLDLVVDVPLQAGWFKDERLAQTLGGQMLRIPVRGTLDKPAPDPRALQELARKAAVGAASGFLNRELEKQIGDPLQKLLDRNRNR